MSSPKPMNKSLYEKVKNEARHKFKTFPSIYASLWIVREYKKIGGKYSLKSKSRRKTGINRWMAEKWIDICKLPKKTPCGRSKIPHNWKKTYPVCRPSIRISSKTPTLVSEFSKQDIKKICERKRKSPLKKLGKLKIKK